MFQIEFTREAVDDLQSFRKHDQQQIIAAIEIQLPHQASEETRNRKRLRPNQLAEWELESAICVFSTTLMQRAQWLKRSNRLQAGQQAIRTW